MLIEEIYQEFLAGDGVSIDSRTIKPNQLFFALEGSRVAGSEFAQHALEKGARLAIVEDPKFRATPNCIVVPSTLATLQELAVVHRNNLQIPILGITGSVGKTTTKELVHAVLNTKFKSYCTQGNLNNHIGVPLSILSIRKDIEIAIIEMGANHIGEIEALCNLAKPTHGLITKIGKAHLEGFGSLEGVVIAKTELYRYLTKNNGTLFINEQDEMLHRISRGFDVKKVYVQENLGSRLMASDPFLTIEINTKEEGATIVHTQIPGKYNLQNIESAICIGRHFNIPMDKIKIGIESYQMKSNRSQLIHHEGNVYLMDAYNANPVSMEASIKSFAEMDTEFKKVLVLGEMRELGMESTAEHQRLLELIQSYTWHQVVLVGNEFSKLPIAPGYHYFDNTSEVYPWFNQQSYDQSIFLIKGSRGVALEKIFKPELFSPGSLH